MNQNINLFRFGLLTLNFGCLVHCILNDKSNQNFTPGHQPSISFEPNNPCVNAPPVQSSYSPQGLILNLGELKIYETHSSNKSTVVVIVYDIFGFHPNTLYFADRLAYDNQFQVVMPDFFRGSAYSIDRVPQSQMEIEAFIQMYGSWDRIVKKDILNVIEYYKAYYQTAFFGVLGFCWGGKMAFKSSMELVDIKAAGLVHPAWDDMNAWNASHCMSPLLLLPSKDEPDLIPFYSDLQKKFGLSCGHMRFDDMPHGFASARGNYQDSLNRERVEQVLGLLKRFYEKNLTS